MEGNQHQANSRIHGQTKKSRNLQNDRKPHILGVVSALEAKKRGGGKGEESPVFECNLLLIISL